MAVQQYAFPHSTWSIVIFGQNTNISVGTSKFLPNLVTYNILKFLKLKIFLKGSDIELLEDVQSNEMTELKVCLANDFQKCF